jgi:hypothetical protein
MEFLKLTHLSLRREFSRYHTKKPLSWKEAEYYHGLGPLQSSNSNNPQLLHCRTM